MFLLVIGVYLLKSKIVKPGEIAFARKRLWKHANFLGNGSIAVK
jgi:hypothetical protein